MRRSSFLTGVVAAALALSATAATAQERFDVDEALSTDELDVTVACPTDEFPEAVDESVVGVGQAPEPDGRFMYLVDNPFDLEAHGGFVTGLYVRDGGDLTEPSETEFDEEAVVIEDGRTYFPYPTEGSTVPYTRVASYDIVYKFSDGTTHTAAATFDDNGCITSLEWQETDALSVAVEFREADAETDLAGPLAADVDEAIDISVVVTNDGDDATLADGWNLGFEVGDFDGGAEAFTLQGCAEGHSGCEDVPAGWVQVIPVDDDKHVIQVTGPAESAQLGPNDEQPEYYRVTFHETGSFTGQVFVFGEPDLS